MVTVVYRIVLLYVVSISICQNVFFVRAASSGDEFSIIIIPDTQLYSDYLPSIFEEQIQWSCSCFDTINAAFLTHVGDVVQWDEKKEQWDSATFCMSCLDKLGIPHGIAPGNHDRTFRGDFVYSDTDIEDAYSNFNRAFSSEIGREANNVGGTYVNGSYTNHYETFEWTFLGDDTPTKFLMLHLQFDVNDDTAAWAARVLIKHSDRQAVIVSHGVLLDCEFGTMTYYVHKLANEHCNVMMIVGGHWFECGGENRACSINRCGHPFYAFTQDFQSRDYGGDGWLRYVTISKKGNNKECCMFTYNPLIDAYESDQNSHFSFTLGGDSCSFGAGCMLDGRTLSSNELISYSLNSSVTVPKSGSQCQGNYVQVASLLITLSSYAVYIMFLVFVYR
jgi:hypothetical protein